MSCLQRRVDQDAVGCTLVLFLNGNHDAVVLWKCVVVVLVFKNKKFVPSRSSACQVRAQLLVPGAGPVTSWSDSVLPGVRNSSSPTLPQCLLHRI